MDGLLLLNETLTLRGLNEVESLIDTTGAHLQKVILLSSHVCEAFWFVWLIG